MGAGAVGGPTSHFENTTRRSEDINISSTRKVVESLQVDFQTENFPSIFHRGRKAARRPLTEGALSLTLTEPLTVGTYCSSATEERQTPLGCCYGVILCSISISSIVLIRNRNPINPFPMGESQRCFT